VEGGDADLETAVPRRSFLNHEDTGRVAGRQNRMNVVSLELEGGDGACSSKIPCPVGYRNTVSRITRIRMARGSGYVGRRVSAVACVVLQLRSVLANSESRNITYLSASGPPLPQGSREKPSQKAEENSEEQNVTAEPADGTSVWLDWQQR
jgi:hypothetical protein